MPIWIGRILGHYSIPPCHRQTQNGRPLHRSEAHWSPLLSSVVLAALTSVWSVWWEMYLLSSVVAFQEILLDRFAFSSRIEVAVEAVLDLSHEEVAGVDLPINSELRIGHLIFYKHQLSQLCHFASLPRKWPVLMALLGTKVLDLLFVREWIHYN